MYFNRMKSFYSQQSSGKYSVDGDVTEWVKVPFNEARYGRDSCGGIVCNNTWFLIRDALAEWTKDKLDAGWTMTRIQNYLKTFDHQDRYDFDGDGNFNEPDGFIDHFQIVHAGGDQADGDPIYGSDAIWSHRWNAQIHPFGTGPAGGAPIGGVQVGEGGVSDPNGANVTIPNNPTGIWVNDYTIQPENGGLQRLRARVRPRPRPAGPLRHLRQHRWRLQHRRALVADEPVARHRSRRPGDRRPADAVRRLGEVPARLARLRRGPLGPHRDRTSSVPASPLSGSAANGLVVLLPNKHVPLELGAPCDTCGERYFYSDKGNDLDTTMTRTVAGGGALTAKVRYDTEEDYDYVYLEASSDGGDTWTNVPTSESDRRGTATASPARPTASGST